MSTEKKAAFTLIELSIVLVIIGLVIGGVLAGRSLIKASEIRQLIAQVEEYKTASNTFILKYNCLAGDCANATSFLENTANGDDTKNFNLQWGSNESLLFWQHLALANLIPGSYTTVAPGAQYVGGINYPSSKMGGVVGVGYFGNFNAGGAVGAGDIFPATYGNTLLIGTPWIGLTARVPLLPSFSGVDALTIDTKFDDGTPAYGKIITWQNQSGYSGGCATTDVASTAEYSNTDVITCNLIFPSAI